MILLDTNVISEMMRTEPDQRVIRWLDAQDEDSTYLSTITCAELRFGIGVMTKGKRRSALEEILENILEVFSERTLPFDGPASKAYADLAVKARISGKGFPSADGYIAAIAFSNGFSIITRDTTPFETVGLNVINPWEQTE